MCKPFLKYRFQVDVLINFNLNPIVKLNKPDTPPPLALKTIQSFTLGLLLRHHITPCDYVHKLQHRNYSL